MTTDLTEEFPWRTSKKLEDMVFMRIFYASEDFSFSFSRSH